MSENRFGKGGKAVEKIKVCLVDDNKELVSMLESYVVKPRGYGSNRYCL